MWIEWELKKKRIKTFFFIKKELIQLHGRERRIEKERKTKLWIKSEYFNLVLFSLRHIFFLCFRRTFSFLPLFVFYSIFLFVFLFISFHYFHFNFVVCIYSIFSWLSIEIVRAILCRLQWHSFSFCVIICLAMDSFLLCVPLFALFFSFSCEYHFSCTYAIWKRWYGVLATVFSYI